MCMSISGKKVLWVAPVITRFILVIHGYSCRVESKNCLLFLLVDWRTITRQDNSLQNATASPIENKLVQNDKIKSSQTGLIAIILLASVVFSAIIAVIVFVFCYRKRLKEKFPGDLKSPKEFRQFELENIPPSSNLIPTEPETPNQTDGNNRTFTFPRGRLSSTGSTNSTTPLLRYRNGSYRSRFSSGVSSRIDSNIAEGIRFWTSLLVRKSYSPKLTIQPDVSLCVTSNQTVLKVQSELLAWYLWQNKPWVALKKFTNVKFPNQKRHYNVSNFMRLSNDWKDLEAMFTLRIISIHHRARAFWATLWRRMGNRQISNNT